MTCIKICGLKDVATARLAWHLGADYLGLVLTQSRRRVSLEEARRIMESLPAAARFTAVGLNVSEALFSAMLDLPVAAVQLHGTTPDHWGARARAAGKLVIATKLGIEADVVLLDGAVPGSGRPRAWEKPSVDVPIWLAGGLTPDNVGEVVCRLRPEGVDVSSGVEIGGRKDPELIRRFIQEVRHADNASA